MKILFTLFFLLAVGTAFAQHPDDYRWDDRFSKPGISNPEYNGYPIRGVLALAANSDYVVIGGRFTVPGNNIALWNKRTLSWEKAGSGVWKNPTQNDYPEVQSLIALGDTIYVFGKFTTAGNIPAKGFAMFNTRTKVWSTDTLFNGIISTISRIGSELIISGSFCISGTTICDHARLSNGQWSQFSSDTTMIPGTISEFKGTLYSNVHYVRPNNYMAISRWTGTTWEPIVKKVFSAGYTYLGLRPTKDYLYILSGMDSMELASGKIIKSGTLVRFDGTEWKSIIYSNFTKDVRVIAFDGEDIYIAGEFTSVQGYNANRIARWENATSRWAALGSGISGDDFGVKINSLLVTDNQVFVAGQFATAGGQSVNNIARFDQSTYTWYPLGDAKTMAPVIIGKGNAFVFNDMNKLLVAGNFEYAGNKRLNSIGYWNGSEWENAGTGVIGGAGFPFSSSSQIFIGPLGITQFARIDTTMYLGGMFEQLGTSLCNNISTYSNGITECVGGGITQSHQASAGMYSYSPSVYALITIGKSLYVSGNFTKAGTIPVSSIAEWNGTQWSNVGGGIVTSDFSKCTIVEDSSHELVAAGKFYQAGTVACNGLASWDGQRWKALGYSPQDSNAAITACCVTSKGEILVAGYMTNAGYNGPTALMRLRGDSFEPIAAITIKGKNTGGIYVMACKGDILYVTGEFDHIGGIGANNVAQYNLNTKQWSALGSGFVKTLSQDTVNFNGVAVHTIAFVGDTVYFGGSFSYVGGKPSFNIASWLPAKPNSVEFVGTSTLNSNLCIKPNPASSSATLTFAIPQAEHVTITLRDALGREVLRILGDELQAGEYQTHIDCSALAAGAYYCVMTGQSGVQSQLLVVGR